MISTQYRVGIVVLMRITLAVLQSPGPRAAYQGGEDWTAL